MEVGSREGGGGRAAVIYVTHRVKDTVATIVYDDVLMNIGVVNLTSELELLHKSVDLQDDVSACWARNGANRKGRTGEVTPSHLTVYFRLWNWPSFACYTRSSNTLRLSLL